MKQAPSTFKRWLRLLRLRRDGVETADVSVRELAFVILVAVVVIGSAFMIAYRFVRPAPPDYFVISTGNEAGAYHLFAQRYRDLLIQEKINVELRPSTGSVENLRRLTDPESDVDVALIQSGIASDEQEYPVRSLGALYYEPLWVFYRGNADLTRLTQLSGKRIAAGPEGSGTRVLAVNMLKASGATERGLMLSPLTGPAAADALISGRIDAAMFVAAPDAPIVQQLLQSGSDIRLMNLVHAEALAQRYSYLSAVTLLRGTVDIAADIPPGKISMVAVTAHLVAREDFHPALVSVLLQAATKIHNSAGVFHKAGEFPAARGGDFQISEDAARYYKSGPPFLQRYMPFWVANLIERLLVLLVPLIAVLIPMMRIMPALYDWRVKRKVFRWYRELKIVETEASHNPDTAEAERLLARLDDIEDGVSATKVPLTYWDYVYTLRGHIDMVRARLTNTAITAETAQLPLPD